MPGTMDQKQLNFTPIRADGQNPFTGNQSLGGAKLTNSAPPTVGGDLVNKDYADTLITGLAWKAPCFVATTANIVLSGPQTIDGVAVVPGNRVLVKNQTIASQNGLYIVAAGAWVRSPDANSTAELDGAATFILTGTDNGGKTFIQTTAEPVIGTDPIVFVQFGTLNGSVASHEIDGFNKTDSDFSSLNPIPGTTKVFTTGRAGRTFFSFFGQVSGLSSFPSDSLAISVDGTVYTLPIFVLQIGAGQDKAFDLALSGSISIPLAAGVHTAFLIGGASGLGFIATPANPMTMTIIYPNLTGGVATASPLARQEVENTTGTPTSVTSGPFVVVPGTHMDIVLSGTQVVDLLALGGVLHSTGDVNGFNGQLGIRIDGTDYPGVPTAWDSIYVHYGAPTLAFKSMVLGPGSHSVDVVFRQGQQGGGFRSGELANSVLYPTRLRAIYTVPQAVTPAVFSLMVNAERVSGDITDPPDSASAWVDLPGPGANPTFDLVFTPGVTGKARFTLSGSAMARQFFFGIGLQVNGVDLLPAGADSGFPNGYAAVGGGRGGATPSSMHGVISFSTLIDVVAGVLTTVRIRYICFIQPGSGQFGSIFATAGHPIRAHVEYN